MKRLFRFALWLLLSIAGTAFAAVPSTIQTTYDIFKLGLKIGQIEEFYRRDKDRYTLVSTTRAVGFFSLFKSGKVIVRSSGLIDEQGLRPLVFSAENENNDKDSKHAEFDWAAKKISLTKHNDHSVMNLPEVTQDRLSAMYQFMFLPLQSPTLDFQMLNGSYLLNYRFDITQGTLIKTPAGEFATLYLDNKAQGAKERTELWLARQYFNLPCKMIITAPDGGKLTQILRILDVSP